MGKESLVAKTSRLTFPSLFQPQRRRNRINDVKEKSSKMVKMYYVFLQLHRGFTSRKLQVYRVNS